MQDVLGTFQDSEAQREAIYALAADMMAREGASARTILAMGEIAARLQVDQDVVAREVRRHVRAVRAAVRCSAGCPGWGTPAQRRAAAPPAGGAMKTAR